MDRVELKSCKLTGSDLTESSLQHTLFEDCIAPYLLLSQTKCRKVSFEKTTLTEADFYRAQLTDVEFSRCDIDKAQFSGTKLAGIDLSSCQFYQLGLTPRELQGCIIAPAQAIALISLLGVVLKK